MGRRGESEVRERAADGRRLGVLETRNGVDVTIADALRREPARGRSLVFQRAKHKRLDRNLVPRTREQPSEDAAAWKAGVEQRDTVSNRRVLTCVEHQLVLWHRHLPRLSPTRQRRREEHIIPNKGRKQVAY